MSAHVEKLLYKYPERFHQLLTQLSSATVIREKLNQNYIKTTSAIKSNLRNHRLMNKLLDRTFHKLVCVIELVRILKLWELIIKPEKRVGERKTSTLYLGNKDLINSEVTRSTRSNLQEIFSSFKVLYM